MSAEVKATEEKKEKEKEKEHKDDKVNQKNEEEEKEVDEIKEEPKMSIREKIRKEWQLILKIVELILCALCLGFFFEPAIRSAKFARDHLEQVALIFLAFTGYMLINSVFIVARCIKDRIPYRISALFSVVAAILFFIAGILLIVDRQKKFEGIALDTSINVVNMVQALLTTSTVLCFVNSAIFAMDGIYTYKLRNDF